MKKIAALSASALLTGTLVACAVNAYAHKAPLGWDYPTSCCSGKDCSPLDARYVREGPDGYIVDIPKGAHPMLTDMGFRQTIAYKVARDSPDGQYHICLSPSVDPGRGHRLYCFFAGSRAY